MTLTEANGQRTPKVYITASAWHIGDLSAPPEKRVTVFVGPAESMIDQLAQSAPGSEWVLDWLKHEGESVRAGEPLAELRSINGLGMIPLRSPVDGVLAEIRAKRGAVPPRSVVAVVSCSEPFRRELDEADAPTVMAVHDLHELRTD